MGSFWHTLNVNKGKSFPRNWVFVDTESSSTTDAKGVETQTCRLGVACYRRGKHGRHNAIEDWYRFHTPTEFWRWTMQNIEPDRRTVMLAFNAGYDFRILNGFRILAGHGWTQTGIYVAAGVCIIKFKRGKGRLIVLDMMNFVEYTLDHWGKILGLAKGKVDFANVSDAKLFEYCKRDVEILAALWDQWREFVEVHDLGLFCLTTPSQAMGAFRHRFMSSAIDIHASQEATDIERASYHGGRVECYHIGTVPGGPFWKVDVNSQYPFIMSRQPVPIRFLGIDKSATRSMLRKYRKRYAFVAEVLIATDEPAYPMPSKEGLLYPVGTFWTVLAGPELLYALDQDHIKKLGRVGIYRQAVLFRRYVETLYALKRQYKASDNMIWLSMTKLLLNGLYGKFGQKSESWKCLGKEKGIEDGSYIVFNGVTRETYKMIHIAEQIWIVNAATESYHGFPAIASYITSGARLYLWNLICQAGRKNVFYVDTDCLIVNAKGRKNLSQVIDPETLGLLKVEYKTTVLQINAPKSYQTDTENKHKGISKSATLVHRNCWRQGQWESLKAAINRGNLDRVLIRQIVKTVSNKYTKGVVHSSGSVSPLSMDAN